MKSKKLKPMGKELLTLLLTTIQPLVEENGKLYTVNCKPTQSLNWTSKRKLTKAFEDKPYKTIKTVHNYGYRGFVKPSAEEVLSQMSSLDLKICAGFTSKIIDESIHKCFTDDGEQHVCITKLYRTKKQIIDIPNPKTFIL